MSYTELVGTDESPSTNSHPSPLSTTHGMDATVPQKKLYEPVPHAEQDAAQVETAQNISGATAIHEPRPRTSLDAQLIKVGRGFAYTELEEHMIREWATKESEKLGVAPGDLPGYGPWERFIEANKSTLPIIRPIASYYQTYRRLFGTTPLSVHPSSSTNTLTSNSSGDASRHLHGVDPDYEEDGDENQEGGNDINDVDSHPTSQAKGNRFSPLEKQLVLQWATDEIRRLKLKDNFLTGYNTWEEFIVERRGELPKERGALAYYQFYRRIAGSRPSISHDGDISSTSILDGLRSAKPHHDEQNNGKDHDEHIDTSEGFMRGRGFSKKEVDLMSLWMHKESLRAGTSGDEIRGPKFWDRFFDAHKAQLPRFRSGLSYYYFYRREPQKFSALLQQRSQTVTFGSIAPSTLPTTSDPQPLAQISPNSPSAPLTTGERELIRCWAGVQCKRLGIDKLVGLEPWERFIKSNREELPDGCSAISYYNFYHHYHLTNAFGQLEESMEHSTPSLPTEYSAGPASTVVNNQPPVASLSNTQNEVVDVSISSKPTPDPHSPISHQSTLKRTRSPSLTQAPSSPPKGKRSRLSEVTVTSQKSNTVKSAHWREFAFRKLDQHIMKMEYSTSDYMLLIKYIMRERPDPDDPMEVLNVLSIIAESEEGSHHDKKWWMRLYYADADFFELLDHRLRTA